MHAKYYIDSSPHKLTGSLSTAKVYQTSTREKQALSLNMIVLIIQLEHRTDRFTYHLAFLVEPEALSQILQLFLLDAWTDFQHLGFQH